jgi:hypothetical protein
MTEPYVCPRCGRTSHHPEDAAQRYCGACHRFEDDELHAAIESKRGDPAFQERLRRHLDEHATVLRKLADND